MIVKEPKTVTAIVHMDVGECFKFSDSYFMVVHDNTPKDDEGYAMCVDLESGLLTQFKNSTAVELVHGEYVVKGGK